MTTDTDRMAGIRPGDVANARHDGHARLLSLPVEGEYLLERRTIRGNVATVNTCRNGRAGHRQRDPKVRPCGVYHEVVVAYEGSESRLVSRIGFDRHPL